MGIPRNRLCTHGKADDGEEDQQQVGGKGPKRVAAH